MTVMGFGRRRNNGNDGTKGKARPKLALVGGIVFAVGVLVVMYGGNIRNLDILSGGGFAVLIGTLMMLFSLSKRNQIRFAKGMKRTSEVLRIVVSVANVKIVAEIIITGHMIR